MPDAGDTLNLGLLHPGEDPTPAPTPGAAIGLLVAGDCPIDPTHARFGAQRRRVRRMRALCGALRTAGLASRGRGAWRLDWEGVAADEASLLEVFFSETTRNGALGFRARLDGEGSPLVALRQRGRLGLAQADYGAYTASLEVESISTPAP